MQNCITLSGFRLSNVLWGILQGKGKHRLVRALPRRVHKWSEAEKAGSFDRQIRKLRKPARHSLVLRLRDTFDAALSVTFDSCREIVSDRQCRKARGAASQG